MWLNSTKWGRCWYKLFSVRWTDVQQGQNLSNSLWWSNHRPMRYNGLTWSLVYIFCETENLILWKTRWKACLHGFIFVGLIYIQFQWLINKLNFLRLKTWTFDFYITRKQFWFSRNWYNCNFGVKMPWDSRRIYHQQNFIIVSVLWQQPHLLALGHKCLILDG